MKRSFLLVSVLLAMAVLSASGQGVVGVSSSSSMGADGVKRGQATFQISKFLPPTVTNAPYSGEEVTENSQTLADGTHITRKNPGLPQKTWRDSQGRVRTEGRGLAFMGGRNVDPDAPPELYQISDPVAGYIYVVDNVNRVAHREQLEARPQRPVVRMAGPSPAGRTGYSGTVGVVGGGGGGRAGIGLDSQGSRPRAEVTTEDLGTKMIDGVLVTGTRRTTVIPEGMEGNDRPMTTTNEIWRSKELQLTVLSVNYSPASGTSTTKIAHLSTAEPDPALFIVPPSYTVVDEKGTFTIKWGEQ